VTDGASVHQAPVDPRLARFDYSLATELIAKRPPAQRDAGRLLARQGEDWQDKVVRDLPSLLAPGDLLVVNDTRVLPARVFARRKTGGAVELLLLERRGNPVRAMVRPARKLSVGEQLDLVDIDGAIAAGFMAQIVDIAEDGARWLHLSPDPATVMAQLGAMPLPPYIDRPADAEDATRYQTVFAAHEGAVAAPTAGLHLTDTLIAALAERGVELARITLHVGPGTFRNLRSADLDRGTLHPEQYAVPQETADAVARTRASGSRVVAVGTTVTRALESAAQPDGQLNVGAFETRLFIHGDYPFAVVDALLTNFHLPRTSLLMLVCAFGGRDAVLAGYRHAVDARYRFYSYGDAMFLTRPQDPRR
jgi:S-adenosylmethionine:tRNA ribosyltransferase-isomerase